MRNLKVLVQIPFLALLTTISAQANAGGLVTELAPLKEAAIAKFVKLANDPKSALGKKIVQINKDTEDGRNQQGTIALPITKDSVQAAIVQGESIYALWHYGEKKGNKCYANASTAKIRIFLSAEMGVHSAEGLDTYAHDINVEENHSFTLVNKNDDCGDLEADRKNYKSVIVVSEPSL